MIIQFINQGNALLPEIDAYTAFFSRFPHIHIQVVDHIPAAGTPADIEWYFMGTHTKKNKHAVTIHEYASASTPPFAGLKNKLKVLINCVPDYRIFFSDYVRNKFNFRDHTPFGLRGHGIIDHTTKTLTTAEKLYDFIYVGSVDKQRRLSPLFDCFTTGRLNNKTLLVLSKNYEETAKHLHAYKNILFKGPVPYHEVYGYIKQCRFAINFMPDIAPYNQQISAKFLDYLACDIPVITSDYNWIRNFEATYGGRYFYLQPSLENLTWENVLQHTYITPGLEGLQWENQIIHSGIPAFLQKKFPGIMDY